MEPLKPQLKSVRPSIKVGVAYISLYPVYSARVDPDYVSLVLSELIQGDIELL